MAKRRLNRHQLARIKHTHEQRRQRAAERVVRRIEQQSDNQPGPEQSGLVIANYGPALIIERSDAGLFRCAVRQNLGNIVCGDRVVWQALSEQEGIVIALEARRSLLSRPDYSGQLKPVAANLDQAVIILAPRPEPSESLIDRYLVVLNAAGIDALLVINKVDLLDAPALQAFEQRFAVYKEIGYRLLYASTRSDHGLDALRDCLNRRTSVMLGQSGVGKSSLIKALLPEREISIQALSEATGHGMHTTTTSMLYHLPVGGHLIDSPGVRSFEPGEVSLEQLAAGFVEFAPFLGSCRFSNCNHTVEPGCALRQALYDGRIDARRLQSFQQIRAALLEKTRL